MPSLHSEPWSVPGWRPAPGGHVIICGMVKPPFRPWPWRPWRLLQQELVLSLQGSLKAAHLLHFLCVLRRLLPECRSAPGDSSSPRIFEKKSEVVYFWREYQFLPPAVSLRLSACAWHPAHASCVPFPKPGVSSQNQEPIL